MRKSPLLPLLALGAVVLGAAGLAVTLAPPADGGEMRRLIVNGVERSYYLHVPAGLPSGAPLVIMLHGDLDDGKKDVRNYGWEHQADVNHFVVAGPDASTMYPDSAPSRHNFRSWNAGVAGQAGIATSDDVSFIAAMIDDIARTDGIDRQRVYVAGFSSGGHMANRLGQEIAGRLAAISTSGASRMTILPQPPSRGIPILFSAGDRDPITPVEGSETEIPDDGVFAKEAHRAVVDRWRTLDACPAAHTIAAPKDTIIEVSGPCRDGSEVRYVLMQGVAHKWPTDKPIDLAQTSWDFFKRFSLPTELEGN